MTTPTIRVNESEQPKLTDLERLEIIEQKLTNYDPELLCLSNTGIADKFIMLQKRIQTLEVQLLELQTKFNGLHAYVEKKLT